jgi:outer membrane immunogenic protein
MKKILLSSVALLGFTAGAMAADLPARVAPVAPAFQAVPVFTWTGFYVGVNAGWAWGNNNDNNNGVFVPAGTFGPASPSGTLFIPENDNGNEGFTGGGQIGYNYQIGSFVVGVEADIQGIATDNNNNDFFLRPAFIPGDVLVAPTGGLRGLDWFGTVRARAGVAFDRWMVFATGGFAYGGGGDNNFCGGVFFDCNNDDTRTGWTVGGGVEYAFTNNFTARLEGLYVNLGSDNSFNGVVFDNASRTLFVGRDSGDNEFGVARAAVNYKFSTY